MKRLSPYTTQQNVNLILGCIGIVGIGMIICNWVLGWDMNFWGLSVYPIFLLNFYQYYKFKQKSITLHNDKIEWDLINSNGLKSIAIKSNETKLESHWKGLMVADNDKVHEVSFDGIWKVDRRKIIKEIEAFYS